MIRFGTDLRLWLAARRSTGSHQGLEALSRLALLLQAEAHTDHLDPRLTHLQRPSLSSWPTLDAYLEMAERDRPEAGRRAPAG